MEVHGEPGGTVPLLDAGVKHPRCVVAPVEFGTLEPHVPWRVEHGANHAEALGTRHRPEPASELNQPRPRIGISITVHPEGQVESRVGHGVVHDAEPRRVRTEVGHMGEQHLRGAVGVEVNGEIHAHSLPRCDPTANPVRCAPCGLVVNPQW